MIIIIYMDSFFKEQKDYIRKGIQRVFQPI